jgi:hypothetical protein
MWKLRGDAREGKPGKSNQETPKVICSSQKSVCDRARRSPEALCAWAGAASAAAIFAGAHRKRIRALAYVEEPKGGRRTAREQGMRARTRGAVT